MRILVLYYSQSGDVAQAARALVAPLEATGATVVWEQLRPKSPYPYPWRSVTRFFDVLPECVLEDPPDIVPPSFDTCEKFDLVILAWQVWFLSPSLPFQAFFRTPHAGVLRDTRVITLSVCRNMWHSAYKIMRRLTATAGGELADNLVVTHQGSVAATFVTTPRTLLFGKKDSAATPPRANIAVADFARLRDLGALLARRLTSSAHARGPLLGDANHVRIDRRYIMPELFGRLLFSIGARVARGLGRFSPRLRLAGLYMLVLALVASIVILIPLQMLLLVVCYPLVRRWLVVYEAELTRPVVPTAAL